MGKAGALSGIKRRKDVRIYTHVNWFLRTRVGLQICIGKHVTNSANNAVFMLFSCEISANRGVFECRNAPVDLYGTRKLPSLISFGC